MLDVFSQGQASVCSPFLWLVKLRPGPKRHQSVRMLFSQYWWLNSGPSHRAISQPFIFYFQMDFAKLPELGPNLWLSCLNISKFWNYRPHPHLLNPGLEALQAAAFDHLMEENLGKCGIQQLQVIVETNQQSQPVWKNKMLVEGSHLGLQPYPPLVPIQRVKSMAAATHQVWFCVL